MRYLLAICLLSMAHSAMAQEPVDPARDAKLRRQLTELAEAIRAMRANEQSIQLQQQQQDPSHIQQGDSGGGMGGGYGGGGSGGGSAPKPREVSVVRVNLKDKAIVDGKYEQMYWSSFTRGNDDAGENALNGGSYETANIFTVLGANKKGKGLDLNLDWTAMMVNDAGIGPGSIYGFCDVFNQIKGKHVKPGETTDASPLKVTDCSKAGPRSKAERDRDPSRLDASMNLGLIEKNGTYQGEMLVQPVYGKTAERTTGLRYQSVKWKVIVTGCETEAGCKIIDKSITVSEPEKVILLADSNFEPRELLATRLPLKRDRASVDRSIGSLPPMNGGNPFTQSNIDKAFQQKIEEGLLTPAGRREAEARRALKDSGIELRPDVTATDYFEGLYEKQREEMRAQARRQQGLPPLPPSPFKNKSAPPLTVEVPVFPSSKKELKKVEPGFQSYPGAQPQYPSLFPKSHFNGLPGLLPPSGQSPRS
jgi:hypothetical protein